jgi:hypothetical protein
MTTYLGLRGFPPPENVFFRRMQNGAFCCILDIKSVYVVKTLKIV